MKTTAVCLAWGIGIVAVYVFSQRWATRRRSLERMLATPGSEEGRATLDPEEVPGGLTRWLFLAGWRAPEASLIFISLGVLALCLGLLLGYVLFATGTIDQLARIFSLVPGGVGELFGSLSYAVPWFLGALVCSLPWLVVHDRRRRRMQQVEQDLPVFLELLATLSEAGLGFDMALARILETQPADRVLAAELRTFQLEVLAGRGRIRCLRRLARRVELTSLTVFVSALVQAEQVGAGVADVLRRQSDDLRDRRRERAMALASALPVKLLFPLVICFLPGVFVFTLGPIFYQLVQSVDKIIQVPTPR